jgi:hypothetical protein
VTQEARTGQVREAPAAKSDPAAPHARPDRSTVSALPDHCAAAPATSDLPGAPEARIAYLEGRVTALEEALVQRSSELRLIQRHVCRRDIILISRLLAGLPLLPRGAYEPAFWQETTALSGADVGTTLKDLWISLFPLDPAVPGK